MYSHGRDLQGLPLFERRQILQELLTPTHEIRLIEQFAGDGQSAFQACVENAIEGVVAKRIDSIYESGHRSKAWLKVKNTGSSEFLICGWFGRSISAL